MILPKIKFKIQNSKFKTLLILALLFFLLIKASTVKAEEEVQSWALIVPDQFKAAIDATFTKKDENGQIKEGQVNVEGYSAIMEPINKAYGWSCILAGEPCSNDPTQSEIFKQSSVLNQTGNMIAGMYESPPANTGIWLADVATNIGVISPAYAQGIGFAALSPVLELWKVMRNISYALLIIVLLVIGLMIMFRAKIDPRTVISIQSALPRIVMTLILITFSYPIAGLMIDLMYILLFLGISIIGPLVPNNDPVTGVATLQADFANGAGLQRMFASLPEQTVIIGTGAIALSIGLLLLPLGIGSILKGGIAKMFAGIGPVTKTIGFAVSGTTAILFLLIILAFVFAIIRIFFILLNSYIQIIIAVIFAPILLLGQAVPGQAAFSNWMRNLAANLIVFPATAILILVADIVSYQFYGENLWVAPVIGSRGEFLASIFIPLGFALVIPQLVMTIKKAFGAKPIAPVGGAVARAIGQPIGMVQQTIGTLGQVRLISSGRPGGGRN